MVMVAHRGRLLPLGSQDGGASPLRVLSMTHTRAFQRAPGCSWAPLPSTWFLTQDGVRVRAAVGRGPGGQEGGGQAPAELIWLKGAAVWALNWATRSSSGWDSGGRLGASSWSTELELCVFQSYRGAWISGGRATRSSGLGLGVEPTCGGRRRGAGASADGGRALSIRFCMRIWCICALCISIISTMSEGGHGGLGHARPAAGDRATPGAERRRSRHRALRAGVEACGSAGPGLCAQTRPFEPY